MAVISQLMDSTGADAELDSMAATPQPMGGEAAVVEPMGSKLCAVTVLLVRGMRWAGAFSSTQLPRRTRSTKAERAFRRCSISRSFHRELSAGAWTLCLRSGRAGRSVRH